MSNIDLRHHKRQHNQRAKSEYQLLAEDESSVISHTIDGIAVLVVIIKTKKREKINSSSLNLPS